jgi:hypothetical protein
LACSSVQKRMMISPWSKLSVSGPLDFSFNTISGYDSSQVKQYETEPRAYPVYPFPFPEACWPAFPRYLTISGAAQCLVRAWLESIV